MEPKYMKISHEDGKTMGIITNVVHKGHENNASFSVAQYEILQEEANSNGELVPAKLLDGFYPLGHFKKLPTEMANFYPKGGDIKPTTGISSYQYIGNDEIE